MMNPQYLKSIPLESLTAARITGQFMPLESPERASECRAGKEKQLNRRVELNLKMGGLQTELGKVMEELRRDNHVD